jgi:hypothetical protein
VYGVADGQRMVGGGCLFIDGENAWLGMGSVLESHRRRGAHTGLLAKRIEAAIEAGVAWLVTETGEPVAAEPNPSLMNLGRSGFETVASRLNFSGPSR